MAGLEAGSRPELIPSRCSSFPKRRACPLAWKINTDRYLPYRPRGVLDRFADYTSRWKRLPPSLAKVGRLEPHPQQGPPVVIAPSALARPRISRRPELLAWPFKLPHAVFRIQTATVSERFRQKAATLRPASPMPSMSKLEGSGVSVQDPLPGTTKPTSPAVCTSSPDPPKPVPGSQ